MTTSTHNHTERRPSTSRKTKLLVAGAAVLLLAGGGLATANVALDHTKVHTYAVNGPIHEIVVKADSGDVDLVAGSAQVQVRETQHYVSTKPTLDRTLDHGVLTIDSHCGSVLLQCYANLRVSVPAGVRVSVDADSGDVEARGVEVRAAHVNADSGHVRLALAGRQGVVWAHSDSGDVDVDAAATTLEARSDSGDVDVTVPHGDYVVEAGTDSGDVDVDGIARNDHAPRSVTAKTDSGDVSVRAR